MIAKTHGPSFAELFTPKFVTTLNEGYRLSDLKADLIAGLTVAIVALPLSMAIAIASGVSPERGLYTSIIGGFVVSALGGSRYQIGGPAGAFIVLVAATLNQHGLDGLILATFLSGLMLLAMGFLRLGTFIKYIPYPVTVGFTSGIAIIIFASQLKELLGLKLTGAEPGPFIPKVMALSSALPSANAMAAVVAAGVILIIMAVRRFRPNWPSFLIATVASGLAVWAFSLPVETLGSRFGELPRTLPMPHLPSFSAAKAIDVLPAALSFALLGAIESLLSAVVADNMTGRRHRSNSEIVAQGAANMASALFGGICVTGTIARTATNVRAGARGPVSGMAHAVFVLLILLIAAPLASFIPLAAFGGVLAVVCWNMVEKREFALLLRASWGDALVLLSTLLLVVFRDVTEGILIGFALGAILFLHRMAQSVEVEPLRPAIPARAEAGQAPLASLPSADGGHDIALCRISGAFFFGAAHSVATALDGIDQTARAYVIDFSAVPVIDSTAAATIEAFARKAHWHQAEVYVVGTRPAVRRALLLQGVRPPHVHFKARASDAVAQAARRAGDGGRQAG